MTTLRNENQGFVWQCINKHVIFQEVNVNKVITLFKLPQRGHTLIMRYNYNVQYIKNKILIIDFTIYHGSLVNWIYP